MIAGGAAALRRILRLPPLAPLKRAIDREIDKTIRTLTGLVPRTECSEEDVFLVGYPKSGTTWFRTLVAGVMFGVDPEQARFGLITDVVPGPTYRYYKRYATPTAFLWHGLPGSTHRNVVYLVRDGRDVMVSYLHHLRATQRREIDFLSLVRNPRGVSAPRFKWHEHVDAWLSNPYNARMLVIKYEDLKKDAVAELQRFCEFVGVEKDRTRLEEIVTKATFERLRQKEIRYGRDIPEWPRDVLFFRRGEIGSHRDEMPPDVLAAFLREAGPTLQKLGYQ